MSVFIVPKDGDFYVANETGELGGPYDTEEQATEAALDFASAVEIVRQNAEDEA